MSLIGFQVDDATIQLRTAPTHKTGESRRLFHLYSSIMKVISIPSGIHMTS